LSDQDRIRELEKKVAELQGEIRGLRQAIPVVYYPPVYVEPWRPIGPFWTTSDQPAYTGEITVGGTY
jgi:hypothetical protein